MVAMAMNEINVKSVSMKTLIKNAQVVLPDKTTQTSVLIAGTKIMAIDPPAATKVDLTIDAAGKVLLPGVIDDQVHFREPGLTHKEDLAHASRACAKGGVTSFLEMPNTIPNATTQSLINDKLALAGKSSLVNYGFYIGATSTNLDDLKTASRTPGIKIFIGSSTGDLLVDDQDVLEKIFAETTLPICAHCEDETTVRANTIKYAGHTDVAVHSKIRDHEAALIATRRAIDLATRHQHRFHVLHVSTAQEVELIAAAPEIVSAEVCPHHLFFNVEDYARLGSLVKMNPSIKTQADNAALWQALLDGTIEVIATDHAPHTLEEKKRPFPECPSGLPAVENSLALMLNLVNLGRCSLEQVVGWMCEAPARIWNIQNKGQIKEGFDADLVLVDMHLKRTVDSATEQTKCKWSPWHGTELTGWAIATWVMGHRVMQCVDGKYQFDDTHLGSEIQFGQET
jgi:dihydroorotase